MKTIPDELIKFADDFSKKYLDLPEGKYKSDSETYTIQYYEGLINEKITTAARISKKTGIIELSKLRFSENGITGNWVFYLILWCINRLNVENHQQGLQENEFCNLDLKTDKLTLGYYLNSGYYLENGRPKKDIANGYCLMFIKADTEYNRERFTVISKILREKQGSELNLKNTTK